MRTETDAILSLQRYVAQALPTFVEVLTELEREAPARPFATVSADGDLDVAGLRDSPWPIVPVTVHAYVRGDTRKLARRAAEDAREALWQALVVGLGDVSAPNIPLYDYTGRPAVQRLTLTGASSGTFRLRLGDAPTVPLTRAAQPVEVRDAVEALPGVGAGNALVYGRAGGPWAIRFDGAVRGVAFAPLTADLATLVGPAPAAQIVELSAGSPDPWRDPRDHMRAEQVRLGGTPDPADRLLRTVTAGLRLTWGRASGRPPLRTHTGIAARASTGAP